MKTYIVYVDGNEEGYIMARNHNDAERKAKLMYPDFNVLVAYTELWNPATKLLSISSSANSAVTFPHMMKLTHWDWSVRCIPILSLFSQWSLTSDQLFGIILKHDWDLLLGMWEPSRWGVFPKRLLWKVCWQVHGPWRSWEETKWAQENKFKTN